ncbi:hypothetical protein [Clostridium sp. DL1XJH146]
MGDGRYYTFNQFFSIIILLALIIFILISTMLIYYRNVKNEGSKYITSIFIQLNIIVLSRFIEEIIVSQAIARILRNIQNIFVVSICAIFSYYLWNYVIPVYKSEKVNLEKRKLKNSIFISVLVIYILIIVIFEIFTKGHIIVANYTFENIVYTKEYIVLLTINLFVLVTISLKIFLLVPKNKIEGLPLYKNKILSFLIIIMSVLPLSIYLLALINKSEYLQFIEFILYFSFSIVMNFLTLSFIPYNVTPIAFDNIKNMILDFVFIVDESGSIIYKNSKIDDVDFFRKITMIDHSNVKILFKGKVEEVWDKLNTPYVQLTKGNQKYYFCYKVRKVKDKNKVIGSIITITEITDLINKIITLDEKKEEAQGINKQLYDYSGKVYKLEKEKMINDLLEEITVVQEKSMLEIVYRLELVLKKIDNEDFEEDIDKLIVLADDNLIKIRKAVTLYNNYYGGLK